MPLATLRKVDGTMMVAIPQAVLEKAKITEGSQVELTVNSEDGSIALRPAGPHYTLAELLAEVDPNAADTDEDRAWINGRAVGSELI